MGQSSRKFSASNSTSRSGSNEGNNVTSQPRLLFHNVHGENIRISRDGTVARRVESFCKGITFGSRPIKINERIYVKFIDVSSNWSGVIRFGFTCQDPSSLVDSLPKYACPDLTNKPGYWAKALHERYCVRNTVLFYYVTNTGDVHFGINDTEKGVFFNGVETRTALWPVIDVYGNTTAVAFVDARFNLNNIRHLTGTTTNMNNDTNSNTVEDQLQQLQLRQHHQERTTAVVEAAGCAVVPAAATPPLRFQPPQWHFQPMVLHRTRGRNVRFSAGRTQAYRSDTEFCQGYVFTGRPLQIDELMVVQVLATEKMYQGCLSIGLTSCDPASLQTVDLPDDSNCLLDRPEYWVLSKDFAPHLNCGDEIQFGIAANGEVQISRNGGAPMVIIHVDQTLKLWAVFDIYGSTQRIRVLSATRAAAVLPPSATIPVTTMAVASPSGLPPSIGMVRGGGGGGGQQMCCVPNGGAVLSVILPPAQAASLLPSVTAAANAVAAPINNFHPLQQHHPFPLHHHHHSIQQQYIRGTPPNYIELKADTTSNCSGHAPGLLATPSCSSSSSPLSSPVVNAQQMGGYHMSAGAECTICYENVIDAVLYMCGHMCMCYECAQQQWRGKGGGHCPLCRATIRDVIRIYKS